MKTQHFQNQIAYAEPLNLAEKEMHHLVEKLESGLTRFMACPQVEDRILTFLSHANGPTASGIASALGINPQEAAQHVSALNRSNLVWSQSSHGVDAGWRLSLEGKHYVRQHH